MSSEIPKLSIPLYLTTWGEQEMDTYGQMTDKSLVHAHIKDTLKSTYVLPYNHPLIPLLLTIFLIDPKHPHAKVHAFRQHVQLLNKNSYAVHATAQVDDGAMRNCIGHHIWHSYGHCLRELKPSVMQISIASGHEVPCDGTWSGEVQNLISFLGNRGSKEYMLYMTMPQIPSGFPPNYLTPQSPTLWKQNKTLSWPNRYQYWTYTQAQCLPTTQTP